MAAHTRSSKIRKSLKPLNEFKRLLLKYYPDQTEDSILITPNSVKGVDVKVRFFDFQIEAKNQEKLNIWESIKQAKSYGDEWLLIYTRNNQPVYVTLDLERFIKIIAKENTMENTQLDELKRITNEILEIVKEIKDKSDNIQHITTDINKEINKNYEI